MGPSPLRHAWTPYSSESRHARSISCRSPSASRVLSELRASIEEQEVQAPPPHLAQPTLQIGTDGEASVQVQVPEQRSSSAHLVSNRNEEDDNRDFQHELLNFLNPHSQQSAVDHIAPVAAPSPQAPLSTSTLLASLTPPLPSISTAFPSNITPPHPALLNPFPPDGTQFHILDSSGNDPSGLATYTPLPPHPDNLTVNPFTGERMFYLTAAPTIFRVSESRLMPVRYRNGDVVKQMGNCVSSRVLRRYVVGRERRYDLRDELGGIWKGVGEEELEGDVGELGTRHGEYVAMDVIGPGKNGLLILGNQVQIKLESLEGLAFENTVSGNELEMVVKDVHDGEGGDQNSVSLEVNDDDLVEVEIQLDGAWS